MPSRLITTPPPAIHRPRITDLADLGLADLGLAASPARRRLGGAGIRRGLRGGGARPFSPGQIAGLVLDLDGDKGVTIATGVSAWADQSGGTAHDAAQATAAKQPTYTVSDAAFNGHGSVTPDGVDDYMQITGDAELDPGMGFDLWFVCELPAIPAGSQRFWFQNNVFQLFFLKTTGQISAQLRDAANLAWATVSSANNYALAKVIVRVCWDGANLGLDVGGESLTVAAPDSRSVLSTVTLWSNTATSLAAPTARILRYSRALSAGESVRLRSHLNARYGL